MKDKQEFPTFDICNLNTDKNINELFSVDRFKGYVDSNPHLKQMHNHHYYHLVYFTEGSGEHIIDFESFPVQSGMMYFMRPGQVHQWRFQNKYDGYVINFSANFFDWLGIHSGILNHFSFFKSMQLQHQVTMITNDQSVEVVSIFEQILQEHALNDSTSNLKIATLLLQLFIDVNRFFNPAGSSINEYQSVLIHNFKDLIEQFFKEKRLPKEYAEMLYITPNHLNALCKDVIGISAGELIRNRVILEAKRLLVNKNITVSEVAYALNFQDVSYFVKFFKKDTHLTPEQFRKQYYL